MCGGAMVIRAFRRLIDAPRARDGLILGAGLAILANSRPYEGFVTTVILASTAGLIRLRHGRPRIGRFARTALPPQLAVAATAEAGMLYGNWRVIGDCFMTAYQIHEREYAAIPYFLWQPIRPAPAYRHPVMAAFELGPQIASHGEWQSVPGAERRIARLWKLLTWFVGPALFVPFLFACGALRSRLSAFGRAVCALMCAAIPRTHVVLPRDFAPAGRLLVLLIVEGWRAMCACRPAGRPIGRALAVTTWWAYLVALVVELAMWPFSAHAWSVARARIVRDPEAGTASTSCLCATIAGTI
jgi:hypothetical protein